MDTVLQEPYPLTNCQPAYWNNIMKKYKTILLAALFILGACNTDPIIQDTAETDKNLLTYRVFTEQSYPPFIMHGGTEVSGFEYDLLEAIAKDQNFKLTYTPHPWKGLFDTLTNNQSDILSAGITITDERKKLMSFSDPYFETESVLLVGKQADIKNFSETISKKIAVKEGTSQDQTAKTHHAVPVYVATTWFTIRSVLNGEADGSLGDYGVMSYYVKEYKDKYNINIVHDTAAEKEQLGFAVKKDNTELLNKINTGLRKLKSNGQYDTIYTKWFGNKPN